MESCKAECRDIVDGERWLPALALYAQEQVTKFSNYAWSSEYNTPPKRVALFVVLNNYILRSQQSLKRLSNERFDSIEILLLTAYGQKTQI